MKHRFQYYEQQMDCITTHKILEAIRFALNRVFLIRGILQIFLQNFMHLSNYNTK